MITEQQKKEILESESHDKYCGEFHCINCPLDEFKDCAERFYEIKLEAEKAKVEKLKKALSDAIISADFFKSYAECNRESYFVCTCSFCKGSKSKESTLRECRKTLKEIEG